MAQPSFTDLSTSITRRGAMAATVAAVIGASALGSFSAAAQQTALTAQQCRDAQIIANAVMAKYRVSPQLADSFGKFVGSKCDMDTDWKLATPLDEKAFAEFRVRIVAMRTADTGKPKTLANR